MKQVYNLRTFSVAFLGHSWIDDVVLAINLCGHGTKSKCGDLVDKLKVDKLIKWGL